MFPASERIVQTLARLQQYADAHAAGSPHPPALSVAISRQAGSGGPEVAHAVGERLGWPVYDRELLKQIAVKRGVPERVLEQLDEHSANWVEEMTGSFTRVNPLEDVYVKQLVELVVSLSRAGHCVIVGRGAPVVLPPQMTLRVRLVAPREWRVARVERQRGLTRAGAEHWVDHTDTERNRFVRYWFHREADDLLAYDLTLNTSRYDPDECAEIIAQAARVMDAKVGSRVSSAVGAESSS
jgi:cytidylate kinase